MVKMMKRKKKFMAVDINSVAKINTINALCKAGQLSEALSLVRKTLSKGKESLDLINIAGILELQIGSANEAIKWLSIMHEHFPKRHDISDNLGSAYCEAGRYEDGKNLYETLLNADTKRIQTWCNLGSAYLKLGDTEAARNAYKSGLDLDKNFVFALTNLALLEGQSGNQELAVKLYKKVLLLQPTVCEIYSDLSRFKRFVKNDPDIIKMEKLMGGKIISPRDKMFLGYALAKAYEDAGEIDKSFENLSIGNSHRRACMQFDIRKIETYVDTIINTFTSDVFEHPKASEFENTPIFIVGMPRSGTTLVEQIIASHSCVIGGGELSYFSDVIKGEGTSNISLSELNENNEDYPIGVLSLSDKDLSVIGNTYIDLVCKRIGKTDIFTDKMPQNFFFLGLIKLALPHAKIIHCRRSPLDTCLSCYSVHFPYGHPFSNDMTELGLYYQEYDRLMCHWNSVLKGHILNIVYEDLVENPQKSIKVVLKFCNLSWEDECLNFHKTQRQVTTASSSQVRQPIYKTAVKRWKRFEVHLKPLIKALGPLADI